MKNSSVFALPKAYLKQMLDYLSQVASWEDEIGFSEEDLTEAEAFAVEAVRVVCKN